MLRGGGASRKRVVMFAHDCDAYRFHYFGESVFTPLEREKKNGEIMLRFCICFFFLHVDKKKKKKLAGFVLAGPLHPPM